MKKRIIAVLAALCVVFAMAGCGASGSNVVAGYVAEDDNVAFIGSQSDFKKEMKNNPEAFAFYVELPEIYQTDCEIEAGSDDVGYYMSFCDEQNKKAGGGQLFTMYFVPTGNKVEFANGEKLGVVNEDGEAAYDLYVDNPSDVQYDVRNKELKERYELMGDERDNIISSLQFCKGFEFQPGE